MSTHSEPPAEAALRWQGGAMDETLIAASRAVLRALGKRSFDPHHAFSEGLISHLACHELISLRPELKDRLWLAYRPWPDESDESIDLWIEGAGEEETIALEIRACDPASAYSGEGSPVCGQMIADFLKLATAVRHRRLDRAYGLLFSDPRFVPEETPFGRLCRGQVGRTMEIGADALHPHVGSMDWADFEELQHPREPTPARLGLTLLSRESGEVGCCWLWGVSAPCLEH